MNLPFQILEHPSDLGIEVYGRSLEDIFCNAAKGLIAVIAGTSHIEPSKKRNVTIDANNRENLLVRWLSEVLFLFDTERFLIADIHMDFLHDNELKATVRGERYQSTKHDLQVDVKAITYHKLTIEEHDDFWLARVFVDI